MDKFRNGVPFDPGYSRYIYSFTDNINYITREYSQLKARHQKKFKLALIESAIIDLIKKCTSIYLGCILWGSFIHYRFKDNTKQIIDNHAKELLKEDSKEIDCAHEAKVMLEYIEIFDRDCKYFLNKPARIDSSIIEILKNYCEFAKLNNYFLDINYTNDIKLPQAAEHFKNLNNEQLDNLYDKISRIIESGKIEDLLEIGFYRV